MPNNATRFDVRDQLIAAHASEADDDRRAYAVLDDAMHAIHNDGERCSEAYVRAARMLAQHVRDTYVDEHELCADTLRRMASGCIVEAIVEAIVNSLIADGFDVRELHAYIDALSVELRIATAVC